MLHVVPKAAAGGLLALVQDDDIVGIDVEETEKGSKRLVGNMRVREAKIGMGSICSKKGSEEAKRICWVVREECYASELMSRLCLVSMLMNEDCCVHRAMLWLCAMKNRRMTSSWRWLAYPCLSESKMADGCSLAD